MARSGTIAHRVLGRLGRAPTLTALGLGTLGGTGFAALGLPLPWLLGALAATTAASLAGLDLRVPEQLRRPKVAVLGTMLGTAFARAARGRTQLAAQPGGAAGVCRAGRGRDLSLSAPLLRVRPDQRIL